MQAVEQCRQDSSIERFLNNVYKIILQTFQFALYCTVLGSELVEFWYHEELLKEFWYQNNVHERS